jgi:hypothetical protein
LITGCCPNCGQKSPIAAFLAETQYKQALLQALAMPASLADLTVRYLGLFAPSSGRAIRADRLTRLLEDLVKLVNGGEVKRHGIATPAPQKLWQQGLEVVIAKRDEGTLDLPLSDHKLLEEIVWRASRKAGDRPKHQAAYREVHQPDAPQQNPQIERQNHLGEINGLKQLLKVARGSAKTQLADNIERLEQKINPGKTT